MLPVHLFDALIVLYLVVIFAMHVRGRRLRAEVAASRTWPAAASQVVEARLDETYTSKVQVFHDPADATRSVIQRRAPLLRRCAVLFVVMFALLGVLIVARMYLAGLLDAQAAGATGRSGTRLAYG